MAPCVRPEKDSLQKDGLHEKANPILDSLHWKVCVL